MEVKDEVTGGIVRLLCTRGNRLNVEARNRQHGGRNWRRDGRQPSLGQGEGKESRNDSRPRRGCTSKKTEGEEENCLASV